MLLRKADKSIASKHIDKYKKRYTIFRSKIVYLFLI